MGNRIIRMIFSRTCAYALPLEVGYRLMNVALAFIAYIPIINRIALCCFMRLQTQKTSPIPASPAFPASASTAPPPQIGEGLSFAPILNLYKGNPLCTLDGKVSIGMSFSDLVSLCSQPNGWCRERIFVIRERNGISCPTSMMIEFKNSSGKRCIFDLVTGKIATKQNRRRLYTSDYQFAVANGYFKTVSAMRYYVKIVTKKYLPALYREAAQLQFSNWTKFPETVEGFDKAFKEAREIESSLEFINKMLAIIHWSLSRMEKLKHSATYVERIIRKNGTLQLKLKTIQLQLESKIKFWAPYSKEYPTFLSVMSCYKRVSKENPTLHTLDGRISIGLTHQELESLYCRNIKIAGVSVIRDSNGFARSIIKPVTLCNGGEIIYFDIVKLKVVSAPKIEN